MAGAAPNAAHNTVARAGRRPIGRPPEKPVAGSAFGSLRSAGERLGGSSPVACCPEVPDMAVTSPPEELVLTLAEAGERMNATERQVRRWIDKGAARVR